MSHNSPVKGRIVQRVMNLSFSDRQLRQVAVLLMVAYVVAIQIPLLSPYRMVPADEIPHVDAAYGVSSGSSPVPAGPLWSHTIPETGVFFAAYPPLYLYLQALILRVIGLSPVAIGLLHSLLRLAAALLFFATSRRLGNSTVISSLFTAVWATIAVGPPGRSEDLAITFLLCSIYVLIQLGGGSRIFWLPGLFIGLTFLTYPAPLGILLPLGLVPWFQCQGKWLSRESVRTLICRYLVIGSVALLVAATWLFWIIPYWHEFRVHFLEFAVPDALAPSYGKSLMDLVRYVVGGFLTSPFPFHYSLLPVLILLGVLIVLDFRYNGVSLKTVLAIALPLAVAALTARVRIHKTYNLIWLIATILVLLPLLWARVFATRLRLADLAPCVRILIILCLIAIGLQMAGHFLLAAIGVVGDIAAVRACGPDPYARLIDQIPPGDKVVTNNSDVFYRIRPRNPVYWPSGLQGQTPGLVPFTTHYDSSFRWLALSRPLDEVDLVNVNPGVKFSWDAETLQYFRQHYVLMISTDLRQECHVLRGLSRFSRMTRSLYLYRYEERGAQYVP